MPSLLLTLGSLLLPAALSLAQVGAPLPGLNATDLPTAGLVTVVTLVPSFRSFIPSPTVVVHSGRTWTVATAPATLTISEGCPCAVTTVSLPPPFVCGWVGLMKGDVVDEVSRPGLLLQGTGRAAGS